jgi:predicted nucleic-acid-binding Zn-ribbon protein
VWETILGRQKARELLGLEDETPSEKKEQTTIIVKKRTGTKVEEDADKFDPVKLVEDIITSDYDPRALSLVDDRDLPRPGNPITFLTDPKFMGIKPFPRQLQIASEFWSAYCPYCSDTRFIRKGIQVDTKLDEIWDRMVLYRNGICPKCGKTRAEAIEDGDHNFYGRLVGVAGQRSGKSVFVSMIAAVHKYGGRSD